MMIGEYAFIAPNGYDPNTDPGVYYVSANQQARATDYANFLAPLYEDAPWLVGDEWFQYTDQPANGRVPNGENNNFGLVNIDDQPYPEVTTAASLLHSILPDRLIQTGPTCDSWAEGPSGVVCNATMPAPATYPVSLIDEPLTGATQGSSYSDTVYAGGGTSPASYKFSLSGKLPKGLKLSKTGTIAGTPTVAGTTAFTVKVVDGTETATQAESLTVAPDVPLSVKTTKLANAKLNVSYSKPVAATGGTAPYTWTVSAGSPPTGLTLGTGGQLTGIPTATGSFTFTVKATDSTATPETATRSLTVVVKS
jgi:Putative Ig domain